MTRSGPVWWIAALAVFFFLRDTPVCVDACCPAFRAGQSFLISDQRILIAWDPETKIEHFVREAAFRRPGRRVSDPSAEASDSRDDFGFLVPSPSEPQIEESDSSAFGVLDSKIQPRIEHEEHWSANPFPIALSPFLLLKASSNPATSNRVDSPPPAMAVLQTKKVAGYQVAVLKADDAKELVQWLKDNEYEVRKDLEEWVAPYVEKGWIITAFKYDSSSNRTEVGTVRISFATEHPVFPYRVPKDQLAKDGQGNRLQVFVVGPGRASGSLGPSPSSEAWTRGQLKYSMPLERLELEKMIGLAIPTDQIKARESMWLTAWDDPTWPSSDKDLWFDFDSNGKTYQEVRTVRVDRSIPLPIDLMGIAAIGAGIWIRRRRNRDA
ncbi:MAG: DUF2330 domain-containing protein [Pirellula sp.]